jgi:hypothetical protein
MYTTVTLKNTLYTPKMVLTLSSVHCIAAAGLLFSLKATPARFYPPLLDRSLLLLLPKSMACMPSLLKWRRVLIWLNKLHCALEHVVQGTVLYMVKQGLIEGVEPNSASTPEFCDACTKAKEIRQLFPAETKNCAHTYRELVHTDLWGPAQTESVAGYLYYISEADDFS